MPGGSTTGAHIPGYSGHLPGYLSENLHGRGFGYLADNRRNLVKAGQSRQNWSQYEAAYTSTASERLGLDLSSLRGHRVASSPAPDYIELTPRQQGSNNSQSKYVPVLVRGSRSARESHAPRPPTAPTSARSSTQAANAQLTWMDPKSKVPGYSGHVPRLLSRDDGVGLTFARSTKLAAHSTPVGDFAEHPPRRNVHTPVQGYSGHVPHLQSTSGAVGTNYRLSLSSARHERRNKVESVPSNASTIAHTPSMRVAAESPRKVNVKASPRRIAPAVAGTPERVKTPRRQAFKPQPPPIVYKSPVCGNSGIYIADMSGHWNQKEFSKKRGPWATSYVSAFSQ